MYKSIILPHAKEDIREAAKWYNNKSQNFWQFTSSRSGFSDSLSRETE